MVKQQAKSIPSNQSNTSKHNKGISQKSISKDKESTFNSKQSNFNIQSIIQNDKQICIENHLFDNFLTITQSRIPVDMKVFLQQNNKLSQFYFFFAMKENICNYEKPILIGFSHKLLGLMAFDHNNFSLDMGQKLFEDSLSDDQLKEIFLSTNKVIYLNIQSTDGLHIHCLSKISKIPINQQEYLIFAELQMDKQLILQLLTLRVQKKIIFNSNVQNSTSIYQKKSLNFINKYYKQEHTTSLQIQQINDQEEDEKLQTIMESDRLDIINERETRKNIWAPISSPNLLLTQNKEYLLDLQFEKEDKAGQFREAFEKQQGIEQNKEKMLSSASRENTPTDSHYPSKKEGIINDTNCSDCFQQNISFSLSSHFEIESNDLKQQQNNPYFFENEFDCFGTMENQINWSSQNFFCSS